MSLYIELSFKGNLKNGIKEVIFLSGKKSFLF